MTLQFAIISRTTPVLFSHQKEGFGPTVSAVFYSYWLDLDHGPINSLVWNPFESFSNWLPIQVLVTFLKGMRCFHYTCTGGVLTSLSTLRRRGVFCFLAQFGGSRRHLALLNRSSEGAKEDIIIFVFVFPSIK